MFIFDGLPKSFLDEDFKALLNLDHLQSLRPNIWAKVSFNESLLSILEKFGPDSLEKNRTNLIC